MLLDTSSLTYRAFFALPASITDDAGRPVNAVRGYLDMTARLIVDHEPDAVHHVFDADWRPAARVAAYPGYKSERAPDPDGLPAQFPLLREVLLTFGQECIEAPGWEADDAIAALCAQVDAPDQVDVVTGDRDLIQLVRDPVVRVLYTLRGVSQLRIFDAAAVREHYAVPPERYVDFAILRGDPSDGLPGVPGVGEKTAQQLVARYATLDELLADADAQTPRLAERLHAAADYVAAMRQVVPLRRDVELVRTVGDRDDAAVDGLAADHNLDGPTGRLRAAIDGMHGRPQVAKR
ncbi:MAG: 5'-3' exonuclease [Actinobacteria bacterium]|nr:5'-3' exonuclease [Actinomycetota bacterium]